MDSTDRSSPVADDHAPEEEYSTRRRPPAWLLLLAGGVLAVPVYYLLPTAGFGQAILLTAVGAASAGLAARAAGRTRGRARRVWVLLAMAMTCSTVANLFYYGVPLLSGRLLGFPSGVDVCWLGMYPFFMAALFSLAGGRRREDRNGDLLDAAIVVLGGGSLMWQFVIAPVVASRGLGNLAHIVAVAYPGMDLLVFAFFVRIFVSGARRNTAVNVLLGSFLTLLAADIVYAIELHNGSYHFGGPPDGLWMTSYLLIGAAALHPGRDCATRVAPSGPLLSRFRLLFLSAAVSIGPALLVAGPRDFAAIAAISGATFMLVMARMTGLNRALTSASARLVDQARTDPLTGLANRFAFNARLESAFQPGHLDGSTRALIFVDLDDFKNVNDSLGHPAGDELLRVVGDRLKRLMRSGDLAARLGGDEFAVWLDALPDTAAGREIALRIVEALNEPFEVGARSVRVGASVGVAFRCSDSRPETLMHQADVAMYAAKAAGKNRVGHFDPALEASLADHHSISTDLLGVAGRGELFLEYQPCVDLRTGEVLGVEALVRWEHPTRGVLPPSTFIGIAEQTGAICEIGVWVLRAAVGQVVRWQAALGRPDLTLSVNVSARQLNDPTFLEEVLEALRASGFSPERLILEVTESVFTDQAGSRVLEAFRLHGIRIAIDDFGIGYSSMSYLHHLPADILKIDRSFVTCAPDASKGQAVLESIINLGRQLELDIVAEGIELPDQLHRLEHLQCPTGQGYLFSKPLPAPAMEDFLARRREALTTARRREALTTASRSGDRLDGPTDLGL